MWDPEAEQEPHVLDLVAGWLRENHALTLNEARLRAAELGLSIRRREFEELKSYFPGAGAATAGAVPVAAPQAGPAAERDPTPSSVPIATTPPPPPDAHVAVVPVPPVSVPKPARTAARPPLDEWLVEFIRAHPNASFIETQDAAAAAGFRLAGSAPYVAARERLGRAPGRKARAVDPVAAPVPRPAPRRKSVGPTDLEPLLASMLAILEERDRLRDALDVIARIVQRAR